MKILVTGGAGYIGSHTVMQLQKEGHEVVVFDNLVYGHKEAITCPLVVGDLLNKGEIVKVFIDNKFDGVIHFAAYSQVGESMKDPAKYFLNNIQGGLNLLEAMRQKNTNNIIFSSTAAVYGVPKTFPIKEDDQKIPVNVYGQSKLYFEGILKWYGQIFNIKSMSLRYFNACGAAIDGSIGEDHRPESHIIPIALQTALGQREKFTINGNDYKTKDGTCVRDYIHVLDLASSHIKGLEYLVNGGKSDYCNVATGNGFSNNQIIETVKRVTGVDFPVDYGPRREGDPDELYADNDKIKKLLGWEPKYSDIETIISSAWKWHKGHPNGY